MKKVTYFLYRCQFSFRYEKILEMFERYNIRNENYKFIFFSRNTGGTKKAKIGENFVLSEVTFSQISSFTFMIYFLIRAGRYKSLNKIQSYVILGKYSPMELIINIRCLKVLFFWIYFLICIQASKIDYIMT